MEESFEDLYENYLVLFSAIASELQKPYGTIEYWLHKLRDEGMLKMRPAIRPVQLGRLVLDRSHNGKYVFERVDGRVARIQYVYPDPELAYIIGFVIGDGHVTVTTVDKKRYVHRVVMFNTEFSLLNMILPQAEKVAEKFGVKARVEYYDREMKWVKTRDEAYMWGYA